MTRREIYLADMRQQAVQQRDRMAELVSEGWLIKDAAREMGIGDGRSWQIWKKIKADLGWQAV